MLGVFSHLALRQAAQTCRGVVRQTRLRSASRKDSVGSGDAAKLLVADGQDDASDHPVGQPAQNVNNSPGRGILTRSYYLWQHEPCFFGWLRGNKPPRVSDNYPSTIWNIPTVKVGDKTAHPTSPTRRGPAWPAH